MTGSERFALDLRDSFRLSQDRSHKTHSQDIERFREEEAAKILTVWVAKLLATRKRHLPRSEVDFVFSVRNYFRITSPYLQRTTTRVGSDDPSRGVALENGKEGIVPLLDLED